MSGFSGQKPPSGFIDTSRVHLEIAWVEREREAMLLRSGSHRSMEICLRFYALEIRMKAIICRHLDLDFLPEACMTHDLAKLIIFSGLHRILNDPANSDIQASWYLLEKYSKKPLNDVRYQPSATLSDATYQNLGNAFDDPIKGVHAWLSGRP